MIAVSTPLAVQDVTSIPYVAADEAHALMRTELDRFLVLVNKLDSVDWDKPTACSEWNVRDILAHQAGGYASGTSYKEMFRQVANKPAPGQLMEDAINAFQLKERADKSPAELIVELQKVGPIGAKKWAYQFRFAKLFSIPHPVAGKLSIRHLMWVIHSRDTWMHRLDICRVTGHDFEQTSEQDGRIAELVMLDVANVLARNFNGPAVVFELTGVAGGIWKIGNGEPVATIRMDVLEFNIFASGRYTFEQARPLANITGDVRVAEETLKHILVVY
ncbi:MAG: maleylpyruvate isomerase family mycothiol-dependent enzyme [Anaerolineales bacterium]|nr:maleylpyruvate isomerase family mycothiol-dependent enzyme [Anaerolineales bacterium]